MLTPKQQTWALRTKARYAPHPYIWIRKAKARPDGLGIIDEGLELSRDELPPVDDASISVPFPTSHVFCIFPCPICPRVVFVLVLIFLVCVFRSFFGFFVVIAVLCIISLLFDRPI